MKVAEITNAQAEKNATRAVATPPFRSANTAADMRTNADTAEEQAALTIADVTAYTDKAVTKNANPWDILIAPTGYQAAMQREILPREKDAVLTERQQTMP